MEQNSVKDTQSDTVANIKSDHYPLTIHIQIKLKADAARSINARVNYEKCNVQQSYAYNSDLRYKLQTNQFTLSNQSGFMTALNPAAAERLPKVKARHNKPGISHAIMQLISKRGEPLLRYDLETAKRLNTQIKNQKRHEKKTYVLQTVSKDLDMRDRWLGISSNPFHILKTTRKAKT